MFKLFIDDLKAAPEGFTLARNSAEAISMIKSKGMPEYVSFDYDLGLGPDSIDGNDNGMIILDFIIDNVKNGTLKIPTGFGYDIHSSNIFAARKMRQKMDELLGKI